MKKIFFLILLIFMFSCTKDKENKDSFTEFIEVEKSENIDSDFYISKTELRNKDYSTYTKYSKINFEYIEKQEEYPVVNISWLDAIKYCNWLSEKEGFSPAYNIEKMQMIDYNGNLTQDISLVEGYRIPLKKEWQYAAKGGKYSNQYIYSGSNDINEVAWYWNNSENSLKATALKKANELGIYDMSGNVYEWCNDNLMTEDYKVIIGGSWAGKESLCELKDNGGAYVYNYGADNIGVRLARTKEVKKQNLDKNLIKINYESGVYTNDLNIIITCEDKEAKIYYTTNGDEPDIYSNLYNEEIVINKTTVLKAIIKKDNYIQSESVEKVYTILKDINYTNEDINYGLLVATTEVTFAEYDIYTKESNLENAYDEGWGRGIRPVIYVSRWDALEYCNWLSMKNNLPKSYNTITGKIIDENGIETEDIEKVKGYRLLDNEEWVYTAKGGEYSMGYLYSGSDNQNEVAWNINNSNNMTQAAGTLKANELGIYDMSGNVWEWCYNKNDEGFEKSVAGGSWFTFGSQAYYNDSIKTFNENLKYINIGFRICRKK